jgi:hypothetical protein
MAAAVGASLHELCYEGHWLARYCVLAIKTISLIRRTNPDVIFFQNPSLILSTLIATLKRLAIVRARTIGDFHNVGVYPPKARFLVPWIVKNSDLIIVSNAHLESVITALGGKCISMPDPIPQLEALPVERSTGSRFEVLFICSWASDEPIMSVLHAAEILDEGHPDLVICITGRPKLERIGWRGPVPRNVFLTGFISSDEFEKRLAAASAVLDLTTRDNCMVCGAYEAVSAEVPMILSDNEPTKRYFHKGALFTDNSSENISELILQLRARHSELKDKVVELKQEILENEKRALRDLRKLVAA